MTYGDSIKNLQIQWELKSRIYEKMKDFETAYTYQLNSALMRDSLFQARNNELLANYNARFNNQKLELEKKQLTLQNTEMRLNRLQDREKMMLLEKNKHASNWRTATYSWNNNRLPSNWKKPKRKNNAWKSYTNKNSCNASKWSKRPISARFGWCSPS